MAEPNPFKTVAVIALSAAGRCLLLKQAGDEYWNFPSAPIADGETVEQAGCEIDGEDAANIDLEDYH